MTDRIVFITGGSRGIGLSCARKFQAAGDQVVVTYVSAAPELRGPTGTKDLYAIKCDVTDNAAVEAAFDETETAFGPANVLVCSAGITDDSLLMRMTEERWDRVIDTNLSGSFRATKRAMNPMLKARDGRIILISSVVGMMGNAGQANYAATKSGLIGFGRSLAREVAKRKVTVNVVAPGLVATDMLAAVTEQQLEALASQVPLGRPAEADEIANAVFFLASAEASYITGVVLAVDGGLGMGN